MLWLTGYWKGKTLSEEHCRKLSESHKGYKPSIEAREKQSASQKGRLVSDETRKKISSGLKGRAVSEETREKMSIGLKGNPAWNKGIPCSNEQKQQISDTLRKRPSTRPIRIPRDPVLVEQERRRKLSIALKGRKFSEETLQKMSSGQQRRTDWLCGDQSSQWRGGISFEPYCHKFNHAFKERVRERFGRRCFTCPITETENGKRLSVHHIDYNKNSICNGKEWAFVPLCRKCHSKSNNKRWYWFNLLINYWALNPEIKI